jgi:hypothetical protein
VNHLRFTASFAIDMETADGWKEIARRELPANAINRRQVLRFPTVTATTIRARLLETNRQLRLCELRVYGPPAPET